MAASRCCGPPCAGRHNMICNRKGPTHVRKTHSLVALAVGWPRWTRHRHNCHHRIPEGPAATGGWAGASAATPSISHTGWPSTPTANPSANNPHQQPGAQGTLALAPVWCWPTSRKYRDPGQGHQTSGNLVFNGDDALVLYRQRDNRQLRPGRWSSSTPWPRNVFDPGHTLRRPPPWAALMRRPP